MAKWIETEHGELINLDELYSIAVDENDPLRRYSIIATSKRRGVSQCLLSSTDPNAIREAYDRLAEDLNPIRAYHGVHMIAEVKNEAIDIKNQRIEELEGLENQPQRPDPAGKAHAMLEIARAVAEEIAPQASNPRKQTTNQE
jgi:hypothetical protein|tara:strand:- start:207 stop:635 length:429 start_codon:yes stop_codon:yes gene_type:complete